MSDAKKIGRGSCGSCGAEALEKHAEGCPTLAHLGDGGFGVGAGGAPPADGSPARLQPAEDAEQPTLAEQVSLLIYAAELPTGLWTNELIARAWLNDAEGREAALADALQVLGLCGNLPQLATLRSTALRVLAVAPELGAELVEQLAALDAAFTGQG